MDLSNADYDTLEDIADGLEKMLHSWNDVQEQRAMEYARLKEALAKDTSQCHKRTTDMKETLENIGVRVSQDSTKDDTFVSPLKPSSPQPQQKGSPEDAAVREKEETRMLPEWAALMTKEFADRVSTKRKGVLKHLYGVKAMPLKKKPRKQIISVQIQDNNRDKRDCTCDEGDKSEERKKWPPSKQNPPSFIKGKDSTSQLKKQLEELQIALLESATEYELKILQMKMQMLQNKNDMSKKSPHTPQQHQNQTDDPDGEAHTVDCSRKQVSRLQREKKDLTKEVFEYRRRERMFEQQRKVLEDAQYRVNCLKRELMKKEGQLVNVQLREKALSVRVSQLEDALRSSSNKSDFVRLWHALPELQEWLQSLRKDGPIRLDHSHLLQLQHYETQIAKVLESLPHKPTEEEAALPFYRNCQAPHQPPLPIDKCRKKLFERYAKQKKESKKEAEALQRELHKLAHPKTLKSVEKAVPSTSDTKSTESVRSKKQVQQPYWLYGAALLLGGLLFRNRCTTLANTT
ncbi:hypothetical protein SELMODRAFT_427420 [Selaginella moellendorffii]|uniref:Uncharacterized protein n=1 Tax=Selaginella moellendorffii TaxID=88036 RepID=D8SZJ1_SELML|nr:hypothetical protein SELMODRAFT_427420 [Selaginella moellendorffii]